MGLEWLAVLVVYLNEKPREVRSKYDRKILGCELLALRARIFFTSIALLPVFAHQ